MEKTCKYLKNCNDELVGCISGSNEDYFKCPYKRGKSNNKTIEEVDTKMSENYLFPWTGNVFGETDLKIITTTKTPTIIGLVGPSDAGKTTLLTALYLLLRKGKQIKDYSFAGSYTLYGWENLANNLTLTNDNQIEWPPHTSRNAGRVPGLLHLSLINKYKQIEDVLFTDAPGEWFTDWANDKNSSKGAQWIDDFSDAFILFADSDAFKKTIGAARKDLKAISGRMANNNKKRPLALVWSKSDIDLSLEVKQPINNRIESEFSTNKIFDISVTPSNNDEHLITILHIIEWLLSKKQKNIIPLAKIEVKNPDDFFFVIR